MAISVSVIICTYNPHKKYLGRVLNALQEQTLPVEAWELLLVDNKSDVRLADTYDLSWHPAGRIVREDQPGLAHARIRGVQETSGEIIIFVDDDNVLQTDYLEQTSAILQEYSFIGSIGGKAIPEYEKKPPDWFVSTGLIGCRNLGEKVITTTYSKDNQRKQIITEYPACAPIGTGQVIRRKAFMCYMQEAAKNSRRTSLGRTGNKLISGEDNDIVLTILKHGWDVGYFPQLVVKHLIPARRTEIKYLAQLNQAMFRSWVYVLHIHGVLPWKPIPAWSVIPRKIKSYIKEQAWKGKQNYICWKGTCGMYEGLAKVQ